jgi:RNA recognition motif-containing protein
MEEMVMFEFKRFGTILSISSKHGYAFVEYDDHLSARDAIETMHLKSVWGHTTLTVEPSYLLTKNKGGQSY